MVTVSVCSCVCLSTSPPHYQTLDRERERWRGSYITVLFLSDGPCWPVCVVLYITPAHHGEACFILIRASDFVSDIWGWGWKTMSEKKKKKNQRQTGRKQKEDTWVLGLVWVSSHTKQTSVTAAPSEGQNLGSFCPPASLCVCVWSWDVILITLGNRVSNLGVVWTGFHLLNLSRHSSIHF